MSPAGAGALTRGRRQRRQSALALAIVVASGAAGLGYQIVWTQQASQWLGHEAAAVLAVVAAFFGGVALGALALGGRIARSARPARWYAGCELLIGGWSLALALLIAPVSAGLLRLTGPMPSPLWQWAVAFLGTFAALLPATAAMGATLPAIERVVALSARARSTAGDGSGWIGALYAGNTFGAVAGVLATALWLLPQIGLLRTALLCALLNLLCAVAALRLAAPSRAFKQPRRPAADSAPPHPRTAAEWPGIALVLLATGWLGIGYEVLVVRVLSQVAQNTVYTFALLLAVYLVGTAIGAAAYQRGWMGAGDPRRQRRRLLLSLAIACGVGMASLWHAEALLREARQALGDGYAAALGAEAALAAAAFLPPTLLMGALFSHLCGQAGAAGAGFGRALGINTLGAAAAPLCFGVLLPAFGAKAGLLMVVGGYLLLSGWPLGWAGAGAAASMLAAAAWAPPLVFVDVPDGGRIVSYEEGATAAVSVVRDAQGVSRLRIDNRQQEGSSASLLADARQALLPLLLHPAPRRALFLGLGTGVTAASAAEDPLLQVQAVELLPEVIAASAGFTPAVSGPVANPRLTLLAADARRFVRSDGPRYDLIVSDNFHPARGGSGALYTVEHFDAVRRRLAQGGLFCQWLPLHQLDLATLRSIVQSFVAVYPGGWAMLATNSLDTPVIGLVAHADGRRFDWEQVDRRLAQSALPRPAAAFGLADAYAVLGSFAAGPAALRAFAGDAPRNTDDHPVVAHLAPRATYAPDSLPRDRLLALLKRWQIAPDELVAPAPDATVASRLAAYWAARRSFIEAGRQVLPSADVRQMLAQVQAPLLAVLGTSADFRPAYDPLLAMAAALARIDHAAARQLLGQLLALQPARPEAASLLQRIGPPAP